MAERKRMFWVRILEDPDYQSLPMAARLLFNAMIMMADDEGREESDNRVWKLRAFPYDTQHFDLGDGEIRAINDVEINRLREMLTATRGKKKSMVIEYDGPEGERLYQITKWARYQNVPFPQPSNYPPPPGFKHARAQDEGPGRRPNMATESQLETIDKMCRERGLVDVEFVEAQGYRMKGLLSRDASLLIRKLSDIDLADRVTEEWQRDAAEVIRAWRHRDHDLADTIIDRYPAAGTETNGLYYTVAKRITGEDQLEIPDLEQLKVMIRDHQPEGERDGSSSAG